MRRYVVAFNLLLAPTACNADTLKMTFTALPATHMNSQDDSSASNATYNGYVNTTIGGIPLQDVICDDFATDTVVPASYTFTSTAFGASGWASAVKFTSSTGYNITNSGASVGDYGVTVAAGATENVSQIQAYETAAVLLTNFDAATPGLTGTALSDTITDYQFALWYLFDNSLTIDGTNETLNNNSLKYLFTAYDLVASTSRSNQDLVAADAANLVIYDDLPKSGAQEFLGIDTQVAAPEPAGWILLSGCGLAFLSARVRAKLARLVRFDVH
jgi:hypothetical protein